MECGCSRSRGEALPGHSKLLRPKCCCWQVTPFKTTFGYCSLHGHYRARGGTLLHALQIGATGFSLKLVRDRKRRAQGNFTREKL